MEVIEYMARLSTCKGCGKQITKEEKYVHSSKSYCKDCYDKIMAEKESYKKLIDSICNYFQITAPTGLILKQIKEYKNTFKYTNEGMLYTLWYCTEILNKKLDIKYGIAVVKYQYENAENYFISQQNIEKTVNNRKEVKTNVVKINLNKVHKQNESNLLFNLEELL